MRFLIVGAGAIGGYFGGRLLQAGVDVSFLLRAKRAAQIQQTGLVIESCFGNVALANPPHLGSENLHEPFDLILLCCKSYDLEQAMNSIAGAVGPDSMILPLLNGMRHLDVLAERFGREHVLGGFCLISAALDEAGRIHHFNDSHTLVFGELNGERTPRIEALDAVFAKANFERSLSTDIVQGMWEKWILIACLAGVNCLMRASIGDIVAAQAEDIALDMLDECNAIAVCNGYKPSVETTARVHRVLTTAGSTLTASMFKDRERGAPTEVDQVLGDLLARSGDIRQYPLLHAAYAQLKVYEAMRRTTDERCPV